MWCLVLNRYVVFFLHAYTKELTDLLVGAEKSHLFVKEGLKEGLAYAGLVAALGYATIAPILVPILRMASAPSYKEHAAQRAAQRAIEEERKKQQNMYR